MLTTDKITAYRNPPKDKQVKKYSEIIFFYYDVTERQQLRQFKCNTA